MIYSPPFDWSKPRNFRKGGDGKVRCALCNEPIDYVELRFDGIIEMHGEYWHTECYAEYFDEMLEVA